MDMIGFNRVMLPVAMVAAAIAVKVWPIVRLRRRTGHWPMGGGLRQVAPEAAHGSRRWHEHPAVFASVIGALNVGQIAWVALYSALGPRAIGVWPTPDWVIFLGWVLVAAGCAIIVAGQRAMGDSWRMGTSRQQTRLVTHGPYRLVRHPIYVGWFVMLTGIMVVSPAVWSAAGLVAFGVVLWAQSLREERVLRGRGDGEYETYTARTGRFVPRPRRATMGLGDGRIG